MTSLTDKAILSGADNRQPMLEKDIYDLWKSRKELYMLNRQHGWMILESVENGPLLWPTVEEDGVTCTHKVAKELWERIQILMQANMEQGSLDECYKLVPSKMSSLKEKQPKRPPPKRTKNLGKSKRTQLTTSSSIESPPSDNGDLPSTKISPRSYHRALKDDLNMSKEQRETRGMFNNLGRALH
nr:hypothetical protein [Tanacetum cinerariifolium]